MGEFLKDKLEKQTHYADFFAAWKAQEFIPNPNENQLLENLEVISQNIGMKEGFVIACFDYRDLSLAFYTDNIEEIIGYPSSFFNRKGIEAVLTMVHPDDRPELFKFQELIFKVFHGLNRKEQQTFEWTYTVRWVHRKTAEDKWFFARVKPYLIDERGNIVFDLHIVVHLTTPPDAKIFDWAYSYTSMNAERVTVGKSEQPKSEVQLTRKEKEIAKLLLDGLSSNEIAEKLFISINTVLTHRKKLLKKLNAKNTAEMMKILISNKFE